MPAEFTERMLRQLGNWKNWTLPAIDGFTEEYTASLVQFLVAGLVDRLRTATQTELSRDSSGNFMVACYFDREANLHAGVPIITASEARPIMKAWHTSVLREPENPKLHMLTTVPSGDECRILPGKLSSWNRPSANHCSICVWFIKPELQS